MPIPRPFSPAIWLTAGAVAVALLLIAAGLDPVTPRAHAASTDLFFSEYIEGTSTNKALEIYNGTGSPITLDGTYDIQIFANGSNSATATISLTGSIPAGGTFVLGRAGAHADLVARSDQTTTNFLYNGNDAVVLRRAGVVLDAIGQIGADPGTAWQSGGVSTIDQSLQRKAEVVEGDADGADAFAPDAEWEALPVDTFAGLGEHTTGGPPNQSPSAQGDSATATHDVIRIDVLANDHDAEGEPLTIIHVSAPGLGAARLVDEGGAIEYTPPAQTWARDSFEYEVADPSGASASAVVEIEYQGPPEPTDPCETPTLLGTDRRDVLFGTAGADVIQAGAGDDLVFGLGGDDVLCGGPGNDLLSGGSGNDILVDAAGRTVAFGGHGDDRITTGPLSDLVWASAGDDAVSTGAGRDWISGGPGDDTLDPGSGRDFINGGPGTDACVIELGDRARRCP